MADSERKGLTPVVAIVMLLMLTILVTGGAFTFINNFMDHQENELQRHISTDVVVSDVNCNGDELEFILTNQGSMNVDLNVVDIFIRNRATGSLTMDSPITTSSQGNPPELEVMGEDRHWRGTETDLIDSFDPGSTYRVEFQFVSNGVGQATGTCTG